MHKLIPIAGLIAGTLLVGACQDNSGDVEKLEGQVAQQQRRFDDAEQEWMNERAELRADIARLQDRLGTIDLDDEDARPLSQQLADLQAGIGELKDSPDADQELTAKLEALEEKLDAVKEEAVEAARVEAARLGSGEVDEEKVAEIMARKMAEEQAANAPTKDLNEALDRIDISQAEKDQIEQFIVDAKQATLETLEIPTADGRIFAEELIDVIIKVQNGDARDSDFAKMYMELQDTPIPGDIEGRTYAQAIDAIKERNREDISRILSEEDQDRLSAAHNDWSDFDVENDPFGDLYMERLQKYEQENGADE